MKSRILLIAGLWLAVAGFCAAADDAAKAAFDKKLQDYPDARNGRSLAVTEDYVAQALPGHAAFVLRFMQYPIAREVRPPLKFNNVFVVKPDRSVLLITEAGDLQNLFADALPSVTTDEQAQMAAKAWLRLSQELHQDGMYQFKDPENIAVRPSADQPGNLQVSGVAALNPTGGNQGQLAATLTFEKGKLTRVSERPDLKAGIRPICQATKLLDPDPIVRGMAEQAILVMGRSCRWYLDEQRALAGPELQAAIDRIWERIVEEGR